MVSGLKCYEVHNIKLTQCVISFSYFSAPILSTCAYEGLVNKSLTEDDNSDKKPKETKCRVSGMLL